jgi:thiamine-phosphate diphosphorylase
LTRLRGLYAIVDPEATADPVRLAGLAMAGGASVVQLRDKRGAAADTLFLAREIAALCRPAGAFFVVNDRVDVALAAGADGVHLGQRDLPVDAARRIAGDRLIVGCSTNTIEEAKGAIDAGADYVGVGAMFPTSSKHDTRPAGLERLRTIRAAVRAPIVAIGGITPENAGSVIEAGADMIAVIGALANATDPAATARFLAGLFAVRSAR